MKRLLLTFVFVLVLVSVPFAGASTGKVTVGEFAVKVSQALGFETRTQTAAVNTLRVAGVSLGSDLNAPLTERMAADIMGSLGLKVTTTNPSNVLTPGKADALATNLALSSLAGPSAGTLPPPPEACRMIFKKDGRIDKGKCIKCCKMAVMSPGSKDKSNGGGKLGRLCDRFCKTGEFPSPSEPEF